MSENRLSRTYEEGLQSRKRLYNHKCPFVLPLNAPNPSYCELLSLFEYWVLIVAFLDKLEKLQSFYYIRWMNDRLT